VDKSKDKKLNAEDDFGFVFDSGPAAAAEGGNAVVSSGGLDDGDLDIDNI